MKWWLLTIGGALAQIWTWAFVINARLICGMDLTCPYGFVTYMTAVGGVFIWVIYCIHRAVTE